ncbi:hypothetical protein MJH54_31835, partial [Salmonella enterica subsp. enterica serovar Montevideo]|nr:hypothetical protein [Salmonella enterica subsp. enterica serovar Montevideo]
VEIKVETNGASGVENAIQPADLVDIAGVIIAADKDVLPDRFNAGTQNNRLHCKQLMADGTIAIVSIHVSPGLLRGSKYGLFPVM